MDIIQTLAQELDKNPQHVKNVVQLLDEGNTIPFIARYRKEMHGAMDDTSLRTLEERLQYLRGLAERRETVKKSIDEQGKLTEELESQIREAEVLIIGGTSLAVYPAAGLIDYFNGKYLVVINKSPTPRDRQADLLISEPIGEVLGGLHV